MVLRLLVSSVLSYLAVRLSFRKSKIQGVKKIVVKNIVHRQGGIPPGKYFLQCGIKCFHYA